MTPDAEDWNRSHNFDELVLNSRGVAFAAFSSVHVLARALGCSLADAERFQLAAQDDFMTMMIEAKCRRDRR